MKLQTTLLVAFLSLIMASFTAKIKITDDFLKQLGITKADADFKIGSGFLYGSLEIYGIKNLKNITSGNKTALTKDLLVYAKQYVNSANFIKEYSAMREKKKPVMPTIQTPDEMQKGIIDNGKKSIADLEQKLKTADASMKPMFEKMLESIRKQLQQAEDPNNKSIVNYRNGYPGMVKARDEGYQQRIAEWESQFPANHQLYIKKRLLDFMNETEDIDFNAELIEKKGIKYFTKSEYEGKSDRWKMAFRAGSSVIEPARAYIQSWIQSLP